jgi:hypothetical protein
MISTRFSPAVALVLGLALVPTIIHSYVGSDVPDGRRAAAIGESLDGLSSTPTERNAAWVQRVLKSDDWVERRYTGEGRNLLLFAARSYDAKTLYHHPELALVRGVDLESEGIVRAPRMPDLPMHVLAARTGAKRYVAAYALIYDGRFIDDPLRFQIRTAGELLFSGRKPLTLIFVSDTNAPAGVALPDTPAASLLVEAVRSFTAQPVSSGN